MPGFNIAGAPSSDQPDNVLGGKDVNRAFRWRLIQTVGVTLDQNIYAKSLTPPSYTVAIESVDGASIEYKFAGKVSWEDVTITFYDVHGLMSELYKMHDSVWLPSAGLQVASKYMGETIFELSDGAGGSSGEWTLKNSWVKSISHSDLDYSDNNLKTVSIVVAYTWAEFKSGASEAYGGSASDYPASYRKLE